MPPQIHEDARKTSGLASASRQRQLRTGLNGERLGLNELDLGADRATAGQQGRWFRFIHALELFLAGMYTGESCAGTPRDEHKSPLTGAAVGSGGRQTAVAGRGKKRS